MGLRIIKDTKRISTIKKNKLLLIEALRWSNKKSGNVETLQEEFLTKIREMRENLESPTKAEKLAVELQKQIKKDLNFDLQKPIDPKTALDLI